MIALAVIAVLLLGSASSSSIVIESENVTHWGDWGPWEYCPQDSFASSFRLKTEDHQTSIKLDDTGLNAIELFCTHPGNTIPIRSITSNEGDYGDWGIKFRCKSNQYINGFQLRAVVPQGGSKSGGAGSSFFGSRDDYGATNLRVFCSGDNTGPIDGDGMDEGEWGRKMICLEDQSVCGIRTQVEYPDEEASSDQPKSFWSSLTDKRWIGYGDYTSLNNVRMKCCDIPNPAATCKPSDKWETVLSCDATMRASSINCKFDKTVGVSNGGSTSSGISESEGASSGTSKGFGVALSALSTNFGTNYGKSKTTGQDWHQAASSTWNSASTTNSEFVVQPGQRSTLEQLVGTCGDFVIRTTNFKVTDFDKDGNLLG